RSSKPGIPTAPADVPKGGVFGMIGPDPGWAWKVVSKYDLPDDDPRLVHVVTGLVMTRAAAFGRAALVEDVEAALAVRGFGADGSNALQEQLGHWRDASSHDKRPGATALAEIDLGLLIQKPERIRWILRHGNQG